VTAMRRSSHALVVITNWRDRTHPDAGGAEEVCEQLAANFVARGYEVVLLTSSVAGEKAHEVVDGYSIIRRGGRFTVYPWALLWLLWNRRHVEGIIDSQNGIPFFTPLAVPAKTPVLMLIHHVHQDQFALYFPPLVATAGRWLERSGARLVYRNRSIVLVSPSTRHGARRRLGLRGEMLVVPPGSDSTVLPLPGGRGRADHPRLVCVGRLFPHKGAASIVQAVAELVGEFPRLELHLVGDGPERPRLETMAEDLGLRGHVFIHGALGDTERDQLLRTAWLSVNTSAGEGWGLTVIEANHLGVPVLAYRRPGLKDSIRDGETGWLLEEGQPLAPAVADALRALADEGLAETMSARTRQWSSQFTWDEMATRVLAMLRAEAGRLAQSPNERRTFTDLATVVRLPLDLLPDGEVPTFRSTDRCMVSDGDLVVLLRGADTQTARIALRRAGVPAAAVDDPRVRITVARPVDLVSPAVSASPRAVAATGRHEDALAG